jgi:hypothetical protein
MVIVIRAAALIDATAQAKNEAVMPRSTAQETKPIPAWDARSLIGAPVSAMPAPSPRTSV